MRHLQLSFCALAAMLCSMWTATASAQTIYRCGNTYSQIPCGDGHSLTVDDSRTAQQKSQTDAATAQTRNLALQLERERVALEKAAMVAGPPQSPDPAKGKARQAGRPAAHSDPASTGRKSRARPGKGGTELELFATPVTIDKKTATGPGPTRSR
jgi:hypothetical protein